MPGVILPYSYILPDWRERVYFPPTIERPYNQGSVENTILVVTNHTPQDLYVRITLFDLEGNEMRRGRLPGRGGAGNAFPEFGFPLSTTVRPLNQVRFVMDPVGSGTPRHALGWGRIDTSAPVPLHAYNWNILSDGNETRSIPVIPLKSLAADELGTGSAHPEPPPARPGTIGPPPPVAGVPPAVVLEIIPPVLEAALYFKSWENGIRADAESMREAGRRKESLLRRLARAVLDR